MAKVVMILGAFVCAVIGGLIAQTVAGGKASLWARSWGSS